MSEIVQPIAPRAKGSRVRWLPVPVILGLAGVAVIILRQLPHRSEQDFNLAVAKVLIATLAALVIWLMFFSGMRWRWRLSVFAGMLAVFALGASCFRIRGVSGNLVPILEPRWARRDWAAPVPSAPVHPASSVPGAADYPQFLGPNRNAVLDGPRFGTNWIARPPVLLWRQPVGTAWSGFVVSGAFAITQEQRGDEEMVIAYDLPTGRVLWTHSDRTRYFTDLAGEGPRANPAVAEGAVFTQGATGRLNCLDLSDGHVVWTKDVLTENHVGVPSWGQSSSPLIFNDWVVVSAGGHHDRALIAYRRRDGGVVWTGGSEGGTYSSPLATKLDGVEQILLFGDSLTGHDAASGKVLWHYPWPGGHPHVAMPVRVKDSDVIVSSGYGTGSGRVSVKRDPSGKWTATEIWRSNRLKAKFTNLVVRQGFLYGLDDGIMACLDAETGQFRWKDGRYGHGQVLLVGNLLLVLAESGDLAMLDPSPDGLREICRSRVLQGKTWNPPALAGEFLVVRNDKEAACYRMPLGF
ncbi:MAG: PQQ-like beta-propeller repeat protein [Verrucomicrobia bacterium]|nr:PQQ-like beta-propeller repeat protein [Verrucomicrobiota bacterium]MBI3867988.1 PQQ-like beta-propeller repeat protein [Verrucomicrobiota bacterium]